MHVLTSLTARLVFIAIAGVAAAALLETAAADHEAEQATRAGIEAQISGRTLDMLDRVAKGPVQAGQELGGGALPGIKAASPALRSGPLDAPLTAAVTRAIGAGVGVAVSPVLSGCRPKWVGAGDPPPRCWLVQARRTGAASTIFVAVLAGRPDRPMAGALPDYFLIVCLIGAAMSAMVAHVVGRPLAQLARSAEAFSQSISPAPVKEAGPREINTALTAFNVMQKRVSEGLAARTGMLAAIAHDLKTPLTRMRLRVEQIDQSHVRDRLVADLITLESRVNSGLEFHRSQSSQEPWLVVDVDALLETLVDDASEFGGDVRLGHTCGGVIRTRPDALVRCLTNLIDNALRYGQSKVDVACDRVDGSIIVSVSDTGPGLRPEEIERVFEPFYRVPSSGPQAPDGAGLGLAIARAQAKLCGGEVRLSAREGGGLVARVELPAVRG